MKQEEANSILKWHGFEVDDLDMIWYNSDRVGDLDGTTLTLADYIPSMVDTDYRSVNKTIININARDAVQRIETQIGRLYDTQRRWDERMRESRLDRVRKYFKQKREMKRKRHDPE